MVQGLSVSRLVNVTINLQPLAAPTRDFGILLITGDSDVINGSERIRNYVDLDSIANDFGTDAPEYQAAALYFGQSPQPAECAIGRWLRTATSGLLDGGILNAIDQQITNFNSITNGSFNISIDGAAPESVTGMNFTSATNLNAVANVITGALTGATCLWDGERFVITSDTTGAGAKANGTITLTTNPSPGVRASGTITLDTNPANNDTVSINGTAVTFVTTTPTSNQVLIGALNTDTAANLQAFLEASSDSNLSDLTYHTVSNVTTCTDILVGTAGNSITLAKSSTHISISGSTLAGGAASDTLTVNGTAITFVDTTPTGSQVLVGTTNNNTTANLQAFLAASSDTNIQKATYASALNITTVTFRLVGTAGNAFTLAKTGSHITLSGAVLTGGVIGSSVSYATVTGSGTDVSSLLKLTAVLASTPVPGFDAETPVQATIALYNASADWYGLTFAAEIMPTDDQILAVSQFIQAASITRIYGITNTQTDALDPLDDSDIGSRIVALGYTRTFGQYSSNAYAISSLFGRMFSVNFAANRSTITLMYKQEPGVTPELLTETQAETLQAKRYNVFVKYQNDTMIIQYGTMFGPAYIDEIHGLDWFQNELQTAEYNLLYQSATKIPQTDAGANQLVNVANSVCNEAVNNGLIAPGQWNADGFGQLQNGQYLKTGYYVYMPPMALQNQSDRAARKAPPMQIALKLAGAIQELDILVNVNR